LPTHASFNLMEVAIQLLKVTDYGHI